MLEVTMLLVFGFMLVMLKKVWRNYSIVGQTLDIMGMPGVQDAVLRVKSNAPLMMKLADRYVFLTKYFPIAAISTMVLMVSLYLHIRGSALTGVETSATTVTLASFIIAGALAWLWTFEDVPQWLYEAHLNVMLAQGRINLNVVEAALLDVETKLAALTDDEISSESEVLMLQHQIAMLQDLADDVTATVADLERQQRELA